MALVARIWVEPTDTSVEPYMLDITMSGVFKWETTFPGRSYGELVSKGSMSAKDMYELAYVGSKTAGKPVPATYKDFAPDWCEVSSGFARDAEVAADQAAADAAATESGEPASLDPTPAVASTAP